MNKLIVSLLLAATGMPAMAAPPAQPAPASSTDPAAMRAEFAQLRAQMDELARRMGRLSVRMGEHGPRAYAFRYLADPNRGMLGVVLEPSDKGLKVVAVTPGGPAEQAGIAAGDVITAVDGKTVRRDDGAVHAFGDVDAGQSVRLSIDRGGTVRKVAVKAERREAMAWPNVVMAHRMNWNDSHGPVDVERVLERARRQLEHARRHDTFFFSAPWWGLNLAPLNPDLGRYFGTDKGALVLSAESSRYPGLKAGDVITAIDGKSVERPEDVMRALRDRKEGQLVRLAVRRHGANTSVRMKTPALTDLLPPPPPAPPAPPRAVGAPPPPVPPAPPADPVQ